jgi:hypothetical protein
MPLRDRIRIAIGSKHSVEDGLRWACTVNHAALSRKGLTASWTRWG